MKSNIKPKEPPKVLVAVPCLDRVDAEFMQTYIDMDKKGIAIKFLMGISSLVYTSRDNLANVAIEGGFDYMLSLDSDMFLPEGLLKQFLADLEETGADQVAGLFFRRRPPYTAPYWSKIRLGGFGQKDTIEELKEYPKDAIFDVDAHGFAAVLTRVSLLKKVKERYNTLFQPFISYGEDLSFCIRAKNCGARLIVDSRVKVGHKASMFITEDVADEYRRIANAGKGENGATDSN